MDTRLSTENQTKNNYHQNPAQHQYLIRTNRDNLKFEHLQSLARNETRVIQVCGFANESTCAAVTNGQDDLGFEAYINVDQVRKIGMAFYETESNPELLDKYFNIVKENQTAFRKACEPMGSPLDTFRCILEEVWPAGAQIQTIHGRKMFVGLSRMVEPNTTFLAHHDIFSEDAPGIYEAESLVSQFAANIYFQVPDVGGELLMWHKNLTTPEFDDLRKDQYGIEIHDLPPPDVIVKPGRGDLLIFDSRKIHAVASPKDKPRMAVSFFIGYRGDDQPLTYWS